MDNIREWTGQSLSVLLRIADDRSMRAAITTQASVGVSQRRPGVTGNQFVCKTCYLRTFVSVSQFLFVSAIACTNRLCHVFVNEESQLTHFFGHLQRVKWAHSPICSR